MSLLAICHLIYIQIGNLEFPIQIGNIGNQDKLTKDKPWSSNLKEIELF